MQFYHDSCKSMTGMKVVTIDLVLMTFAPFSAYLVVIIPASVNTRVVHQSRETATTGGMRTVAVVEPLPPFGVLLQRLEWRLWRKPDAADAAFSRAIAPGYVPPEASGHASTGTVRGIVTVDPSLEGNVTDMDSVFIFARAVPEPRVPAAVMRRQASELPVEFVLDDSMAMKPEFRISRFNEVVIGARISASDKAGASDIGGVSGVVYMGGLEVVAVRVDQSVLTTTTVS